jgi:hypothetical protein
MGSAFGCLAQTSTTQGGTEAPGAAPAQSPLSPALSWNDRARFLAGLPVPESSPLAKLEQTPSWKDHQKALDADWATLGARLKKMSAWTRAELDPRIDPTRPLIYLFGGPDLIGAMTFFPEASSYLLAGLEPVGQVSAPEALDSKTLDQALAAIAYALRTTVRTSFFRTNEMGRDLSEKRKLGIRGVLPIMLLFAARSGATVLDVEAIDIDPLSGAVTPRPEGESSAGGIPAVQLEIQRPGAAESQTITYVRADLLNENVAKTPGFFAFARRFSPGNVLLKAASFILEDNNFSVTRDFLLASAVAVLQEDSGIPFRFFKKESWGYTCFGKYVRPRPPFQRHFQADLGAACALEPERPLSFIVGYRRTDDSNLFLAVKKEAEACFGPQGTNAAKAPQP